MTRTLSVAVVVTLSGCLQPVMDEDDRGLSTANLATDGSCTAVTLVNPGNSVQPATSCLCTRRDPTVVGQCRKGVGDSASATIGPAGGTLKLVGKQGGDSVPFKITFEPGALASPVVITVTETALPPPGVDWSPVYKVEPLGLEVSAGARISVPNSQGLNESRADDNKKLFASGTTQCALEVVGDSYANAGFNTGTINKLGYVMVGYVERGLSPSCN